jgi:hypothetical protein
LDYWIRLKNPILKSKKNPLKSNFYWIFGVGFGRILNHPSNQKFKKVLTEFLAPGKEVNFFLDFGLDG